MPANLQSSKLIQLRAKTDRDLVTLIDNALENALLLTGVEPDVDPVGALHRRAANIYADTVMLVVAVENVQERRRLEKWLRRLRDSLERRHAQVASA